MLSVAFCAEKLRGWSLGVMLLSLSLLLYLAILLCQVLCHSHSQTKQLWSQNRKLAFAN